MKFNFYFMCIFVVYKINYVVRFDFYVYRGSCFKNLIIICVIFYMFIRIYGKYFYS